MSKQFDPVPYNIDSPLETNKIRYTLDITYIIISMDNGYTVKTTKIH